MQSLSDGNELDLHEKEPVGKHVYIDPLHKWRLNFNNNTWYILSLTFM